MQKDPFSNWKPANTVKHNIHQKWLARRRLALAVGGVIALTLVLVMTAEMSRTPPVMQSTGNAQEQGPASPSPVTAIDPTVQPMPSATYANATNALWQQPGWASCVAAYKNAFNPKTQKPWWYRYDGRRCAEELPDERPGALFLMIAGPDRLVRNRRGIEVTLYELDIAGYAQTLCSTRKGYYTDEFEKRMRDEKRCTNFPHLLADEVSLVHYKARPKPQAATVRTNEIDGGTAHCEVIVDQGYTKKIVSYQLGGRTYAINGHARSLTDTGIFIDGFERFSPDEMQMLLRRGLERCP
jgi:hypothetical protein